MWRSLLSSWMYFCTDASNNLFFTWQYILFQTLVEKIISFGGFLFCSHDYCNSQALVRIRTLIGYWLYAAVKDWDSNRGERPRSAGNRYMWRSWKLNFLLICYFTGQTCLVSQRYVRSMVNSFPTMAVAWSFFPSLIYTRIQHVQCFRCRWLWNVDLHNCVSL